MLPSVLYKGQMPKKILNLAKSYQSIIQNEVPWFSKKSYQHFDRPISISQLKNKVETKKIIDKLCSDCNIEKHSFYPFIGYDIKERKIGLINKLKYYKKKCTTLVNSDDKEKCNNQIKKFEEDKINKIRPIRYAAHFDGYIYSFYADKLAKIYENKIQEIGLKNEVLAYRKLEPIFIGNSMIKQNNCTMAKSVFDEIMSRSCNCIALTFDIASFYDTIDHKNLKTEWAKLLGLKELPKAEYNIFKSLTKYTYVKTAEVKEYLKIKKENVLTNVSQREFKKVKSKFIPWFKNASDFREFRNWYKEHYKNTNHKNFHKNEGASRDKPHGIPQGSPMSSILSNIYLLPFDIKMKELANSIDGVYRRYCDDIIFICPPGEANKNLIVNEIKIAIEARGEYLKIHPIEDWDKYSKSKFHDFTTDKIKSEPLQYLGFIFDGHNVRIRESSLANYFRKSKLGLAAAKNNAINKINRLFEIGIILQEKHKKLYRKSLYSRYTHLGHKNFISYAFRAYSTTHDNTIRQQIKRHFIKLNENIKKADIEINKVVQKKLNCIQNTF